MAFRIRAMNTRSIDRVILLTCGVSLLGSAAGMGWIYTDRWRSQARTSSAVGVTRQVRSGTELLAIFVGSSGCGASRYPGLPDALMRARGQLRAEGQAAGKQLVSVGIALDAEPDVGIEFLEAYGPFDEILSGGNWLNTGAINFLIRDIPGALALPQLIIIEREVIAQPATISVGQDRLVSRLVGADAIIAYADRWPGAIKPTRAEVQGSPS